MNKLEIKKHVEELTGKQFPNLCKLSLLEMKKIKELAQEADAFWRQDGSLFETGVIGCGAVCEHGHNELTCMECNDNE